MKKGSQGRFPAIAAVTGIVGFCLLAFLVKVPEPHLHEAGNLRVSSDSPKLSFGWKPEKAPPGSLAR